jgi:hypothetical protein
MRNGAAAPMRASIAAMMPSAHPRSALFHATVAVERAMIS